MKAVFLTLSVFALLVSAMTGFALAAEPEQESVERDRKRIEGVWKIVSLEINGQKLNDAEVDKLRVVNGPSGVWSLRLDEQEISKGTSQFEPTRQPKRIDFTVTEGNGAGNQHLGIYQLAEDSRTLCFAQPGGDRPSEFSAAAGSNHILVVLQRVKQP